MTHAAWLVPLLLRSTRSRRFSNSSSVKSAQHFMHLTVFFSSLSSIANATKSKA
jgi:hypothetical protein